MYVLADWFLTDGRSPWKVWSKLPSSSSKNSACLYKLVCYLSWFYVFCYTVFVNILQKTVGVRIVTCSLSDCGKKYFYVLTSEITSPNYPDSYGPDTRCYYYIYNPFDYLLTITFHTFSTEYHSDCAFEYLQVSISCPGLHLHAVCTVNK